MSGGVDISSLPHGAVEHWMPSRAMNQYSHRALGAANEFEIVVSTQDAERQEEWRSKMADTQAHFYLAQEKCLQAPEEREVSVRLREAGAYFKYTVERYDTLPGATAFIHDDIEIHNPVWRRWLACLRPKIDTVSLSPLLFPSNPKVKGRAQRAAEASGVSARQTVGVGYGPPTCCLIVVQSRGEIQTLPRAAYLDQLEGLRNGTIDAWDHEVCGPSPDLFGRLCCASLQPPRVR